MRDDLISLFDYGKESWMMAWESEAEVKAVIKSLCDRHLKGATTSKAKRAFNCGSRYHICLAFVRND